MKVKIETPADIYDLSGKFLLEVNCKNPEQTIMQMGWDFAKEKRLYIVCKNGLFTLCGDSVLFDSFKEFQSVLNNYYNGKRFYRTLTNNELDYVIEQIRIFNCEITGNTHTQIDYETRG